MAALQKLNSKRGASIVLALMFFLVCAVIGSIVLFSAFSNAGRMSHMRVEQQAYLTVSSAARLVRDELNGLSFHAVRHSRPDLHGVNPDFFKQTSPATSLSAPVTGMVEHIYDTNTAAPDLDFVITATGLDPVKGTLSVSADANDKYAITVTLGIEGSGGYAMKIDVPVTCTPANSVHYITVSGTGPGGEPTTYEIPCNVTQIYIDYGEGLITKGGG